MDPHGKPFALKAGEISWTATGGTIDASGIFEAGSEEGPFQVTAAVGPTTATAAVQVLTEPPPITPPPLPPAPKTKLRWSGEVSPQKWTQFYMKVLTKLVSSGEVKLSVTIEAESPQGVTEQQTEEIKAALRGLGLDDGVEVE